MPLSPSNTQQSLRETLEETIGRELAGALEDKGFERLTPVQEAVLAPELSGKDLRISSQTGSGKTVAIGLTLRNDVTGEEPEAQPEEGDTSGNLKGRDQRARPRALVVTPTRELAKQVEEELSWLFAPLEAKVASVTGGGGYRDSSGQIATRRNNCGDGHYNIYEKPASSCRPPTARPGTSMHERGLAIDFTQGGSTLTRSSSGFHWLKANAASFGFYNLPSEPWHWSTNGN